MTPEMKKALQSSDKEEGSLEAVDEVPAPNALAQSYSANTLNVNQLPGNNDPFSISKNRVNGEVRPSIFDKFNSGKGSETPIGGIEQESSSFDTPIGAEPSLQSESLLEKVDGSQQLATRNTVEPPAAPSRKARSGQGLGTELAGDAPPRMRSNTMRPQSRSKVESDETSNGRPPSVVNGVGERKRTISGQAASTASTAARSHEASNISDPTAPQRRSVRLFNRIPGPGKFSVSSSAASKEERESKKKARATGTKGRSSNPVNVGRVVSGNRIHVEAMDIDGKEQRRPSTQQSTVGAKQPRAPLSDAVKEKEALSGLLDLFHKLASAYFAQSHYKCEEARKIYNMIPLAQRETPWVLSQIGRALVEQASYTDAEKTYARLRVIAPSRVDEMDWYSTCLWHLKKVPDLAFLAHEIVEIDRNSPQAWVVVGNLFSLQQDHDNAIKCFKRATQLDPNFTYAYTLQGHEYIENEEMEKALYAFRSALSIDNRHYTSWYGIGRVHECNGKYDHAETHYRTAAGINPSNGILLACIGGVLEKMKNPREALRQYDKACAVAPASNTLPRFKRARLLYHLRKPEQAYEELAALKDLMPDEPNVWFYLGKVCLMLKQKSHAVRYLTVAGNLDPKVCSVIFPIMLIYGP